jgi:type I restriction enzyme, S subunit
MKESGILSIGEIPEHWNVAPLYSRYDLQLGKMLDAKRITGKHLAPYLRNIDVQWDYINVDKLPEMDFELHERKHFSLEVGDLLICEGGESGRTAIWRGDLPECFYQKALHRLRPQKKERDHPRFFYYLMFATTKLGVFLAGSNSNIIQHLPAEKLKVYRFPFPSFLEQLEIVNYLDQQFSGINQLIIKTELVIEKLQEYRRSLITAAVTGKLEIGEVEPNV